MPDTIKTQISGKFSEDDTGIFQLKQKLVEAGIIVEFPFGDRIIGECKGIPVTFTPSAERLFYEVELDFFRAIRTNPIHILHNKHGENRGYIGESASIETAYAILHAKPVILLYWPIFSANVPPPVQKLLERNKSKFLVARIETFPVERLSDYLARAIENFSGGYDLCDTETEVGMMGAIAKLFESYKSL